MTHLVFRDGRSTYLKKAMIQKCFIVSPLWIDQMMIEGKFLPETKFICEQQYDLLATPKTLKNFAKNEDISTPEHKRVRLLMLLRSYYS